MTYTVRRYIDGKLEGAEPEAWRSKSPWDRPSVAPAPDLPDVSAILGSLERGHEHLLACPEIHRAAIAGKLSSKVRSRRSNKRFSVKQTEDGILITRTE